MTSKFNIEDLYLPDQSVLFPASTQALENSSKVIEALSNEENESVNINFFMTFHKGKLEYSLIDHLHQLLTEVESHPNTGFFVEGAIDRVVSMVRFLASEYEKGAYDNFMAQLETQMEESIRHNFTMVTGAAIRIVKDFGSMIAEIDLEASFQSEALNQQITAIALSAMVPLAAHR